VTCCSMPCRVSGIVVILPYVDAAEAAALTSALLASVSHKIISTNGARMDAIWVAWKKTVFSKPGIIPQCGYMQLNRIELCAETLVYTARISSSEPKPSTW
jgi:hypothetical protein